jgi:drug/metabolite transporter (DMT)-like permease
MTTSVQRPTGRFVGLWLAFGAAMAMGSAAAAMKALGATGLPAVNVVQARLLVAAAALMAVALVVRRGRVRVARRDWWLVGAYGVVSLAANQLVFMMSLARLSVGVALLLEYLAPMLVALWVRFVRREPVSGLVWVGIVGTLLGLGMVARVWAGFALDGVGFVLGLLAAVTMATRFVLADRGLRRQDPLVLAAWGTTVSAGALLLTGTVAPFPVDALTQEVDLNGIAVPVVLLVAWVGLVGTAGGVLLAVAAQRLLAPTSTSLVVSLEVVVGAALAYAVLGESLAGVQVLGGVVMLAGVAVAQVAIARGPVTPFAVSVDAVVHRVGRDRGGHGAQLGKQAGLAGEQHPHQPQPVDGGGQLEQPLAVADREQAVGGEHVRECARLDVGFRLGPLARLPGGGAVAAVGGPGRGGQDAGELADRGVVGGVVGEVFHRAHQVGLRVGVQVEQPEAAGAAGDDVETAVGQSFDVAQLRRAADAV